MHVMLTVPPFAVQFDISVFPAALKLPYTTKFVAFAIAQPGKLLQSLDTLPR